MLALFQRLQGILPANGYNTDVGTRVYWHPLRIEEEDMKAAKSVLEVRQDSSAPKAADGQAGARAGVPYEDAVDVFITVKVYDADPTTALGLLDKLELDVRYAALRDFNAVWNTSTLDAPPAGTSTWIQEMQFTIAVGDCRDV